MDIKVFITNREAVCSDCGKQLGSHAWITLIEGKGALCLPCADLDHLVYLPSGEAALTRRATKYSPLAAVVLKWSRARKRYERQGILVEEAALQQAETDCLLDAEARTRRQERDAIRRAEQDQEYIANFAKRVRELCPHCPDGREQIIAEHACQKYSGRGGRTAEAKNFENNTIWLAVVAHIRHRETNYDDLLMEGLDRSLARSRVEEKVERVLQHWTEG